jgi:16S rRNA (guanine527-N7)-methyltransferase
MAPLPDLPLLWTALRRLDLQPDGLARERLRAYADLLVRRGGVTGATAVTDLPGVQRRHLLEALAFYASLRARGVLAAGDTLRIADVGSGGGVPGVPLAIMLPEASVTLIEATTRKAGLLREAARLLGLDRVTVAAERAETLGNTPDERETYDLVVSRAVATLPVLAELSLPLLRPGGLMAAMKGSHAADEASQATRAIALLGGSEAEIIPLPVPGGEERLFVALIAKAAPTPPGYPRRPGIPAKRPLR